ncbi:GNAT family N-acetyltransferase [Ohtaekwangia koreensis]|uniref:Ribosomal protein S18 acetylase RimI n=1 Tax=Ohtaekwangia koreensis TaxID=688867 RepID=A0A1T5LET9_9BACT|nr:GNAT family N-acetyltransferase [Ohtaekwangia koreensis]SKC74511.1 Ribosomal protein S18 acetylase RimI [Ohtaekwangia koreensis]
MITIRKSIASDIPILIDFQQKLALETEHVSLDPQILKKGLQALFDDPSKGFYNVVEESGIIIGCHMVTYEWSDWRNGMVLWLQSVYVMEAYRKKGIFKMMYDNILRIISEDDSLIGLRLYVDKTNERAMKVYQALGMNGDHYTVYEWMK